MSCYVEFMIKETEYDRISKAEFAHKDLIQGIDKFTKTCSFVSNAFQMVFGDMLYDYIDTAAIIKMFTQSIGEFSYYDELINTFLLHKRGEIDKEEFIASIEESVSMVNYVKEVTEFINKYNLIMLPVAAEHTINEFEKKGYIIIRED